MHALVRWHKSSYSGTESNCVEVGSAPGIVGVRDTKSPDRGVLVFTTDAWSRFIRDLKIHTIG